MRQSGASSISTMRAVRCMTSTGKFLHTRVTSEWYSFTVRSSAGREWSSEERGKRKQTNVNTGNRGIRARIRFKITPWQLFPVFTYVRTSLFRRHHKLLICASSKVLSRKLMGSLFFLYTNVVWSEGKTQHCDHVTLFVLQLYNVWRGLHHDDCMSGV